MKKLFEKLSVKKRILICIIALAIIGAVICLIVFVFPSGAPETVANSVDAHYTQLAKKDNPTVTDADKALKDYSKEQKNGEIVYTKGKESVKVQIDENGNITYLSYTNALGDDEKVELHNFNEKMIAIGDSEQKVLDVLSKDNYVYNLQTINEEGQKLHIYYFGWYNKEALLELVFTDGKLTYYTINSQDIAIVPDAPDIKDFY